MLNTSTQIRQATRNLARMKSSGAAIAVVLSVLTIPLEAATHRTPPNRSGSVSKSPARSAPVYRTPSAPSRPTPPSSSFRRPASSPNLGSSMGRPSLPTTSMTSKPSSGQGSSNGKGPGMAPGSTAKTGAGPKGTATNPNTNKNTNINNNTNTNTNVSKGSPGTRVGGANPGSRAKSSGMNNGTGGNGVATNTNINKNTNININKVSGPGPRTGGGPVPEGPMGRNRAGLIPEDHFRSHFGRDHEFHVNRGVMIGDHPDFRFGDVSFRLVRPWPVAWRETDVVYVDYVGGSYFLCNRAFPGVRVLINVGACSACTPPPVMAANCESCAQPTTVDTAGTECTDCAAPYDGDDSNGVPRLTRGQTTDQVVAVLGTPSNIVDLGVRKIYLYRDMKVTFLAGRVSDVR
jgi:hypothetical protein